MLTLTTVTILEAIRGFTKVRSRRRLQQFLTAIAMEEVLILDRPAAELAGRMIGELEQAGLTIGLADPMIAAIALIHDLELVTGNIDHFQRIQRLGYPLVLVNWRKSAHPTG
jgi:tRNA(fMet)-specific endonuclease VapC